MFWFGVDACDLRFFKAPDHPAARAGEVPSRRSLMAEIGENHSNAMQNDLNFLCFVLQ